MYLYPYLPLAVASELAEKKAAMPIEQLADLERSRSFPVHTAARFAPTGGYPIDENALLDLREAVLGVARLCGYPSAANQSARLHFDVECSRVLFDSMQIAPSEAANLYMWAHMTCVLLPDVVRWRFMPSDSKAKTSEERFIGGSKGRRRNTFGRLWWRAYFLTDKQWENPYYLLKELSEDNIVQIVDERPSTAGSPILVKQIGLTSVRFAKDNPEISSRELIRDAMKRINRLLSMLAFDALDEDVLQHLLTDIFTQSLEALIHASISLTR